MTFLKYENVYVYSAWKLWLAYGIAIALAAASVGLALITIWVSKASFSDNFSTIFRVARGADVSVVIQTQDMTGEDPLPSYLSKARVRLGGDTGASAGKRGESSSSPSIFRESPRPGTPEAVSERGSLVSHNDSGA